MQPTHTQLCNRLYFFMALSAISTLNLTSVSPFFVRARMLVQHGCELTTEKNLNWLDLGVEYLLAAAAVGCSRRAVYLRMESCMHLNFRRVAPTNFIVCEIIRTRYWGARHVPPSGCGETRVPRRTASRITWQILDRKGWGFLAEDKSEPRFAFDLIETPPWERARGKCLKD